MIAIRSCKRLVLALGFLFLLMPVAVSQAVPEEPAKWNRLFNEAQVAFAANNLDLAIQKIREMGAAPGDNKTASLELLIYNIGLANFLREKYPQAEDAFNDCIRRFPNSEYTSRCFLGLGRACMRVGDPQVRWRAISALKIAAKDPRCRAEASLWMGEVYSDFRKTEEALAVYRGFIGTEVRTFQQVAAAVAVLGLLADQGRLDELEAQLGSFARQTGVRDSIDWFANQMIVRGDESAAWEDYQSALVFYRSVPSRGELLEIQRGALEKMHRKLASLESGVKAEAKLPITRRSIEPRVVANLGSTVAQAETMLKAVDEKTDLDAMLLMRRGRCLLRLNRYEEALVCFRTIRTQYPDAMDAGMAARAELIAYSRIFMHPHPGNRGTIELFSDDFLWDFGSG